MSSLCRAGHSRSVHSSNSGKPLMQSSLRLGSLPTVRILQFMQFLKLCLGKREDGSSEDEIYKVYSNKEDSTDEDIANCSGKDEFFTTLESSYVDEELRNAKETMRDLKKKKGANKEDKAANQDPRSEGLINNELNEDEADPPAKRRSIGAHYDLDYQGLIPAIEEELLDTEHKSKFVSYQTQQCQVKRASKVTSDLGFQTTKSQMKRQVSYYFSTIAAGEVWEGYDKDI
ncbi:hypothetical protein GH714_025955 [Hevea brasiliensis]|uniref:Uncharacterized protein n=1 Tax=Hevea brasiliensis TaxID=3981 RepID=A0A6A6N1Z7_HEVBR|nr:hypothetical protein GH714_025955 [Hevea brasiliensis]